jgi:hypothetical protein
MVRTAAVTGLAVVLVASVAVAAADAKRRRGKVVRVERGRGAAPMVPRICSIDTSGNLGCWGQPPRKGEIGAVITEQRRIATVAVTKVEPQVDSCGTTTSWGGTGEVRSGALDQAYGMQYLLLDLPSTPHSRVVSYPGVTSPSRPQVEQIYFGIDDDGDNLLDFLVGYFACDRAGTPSQSYGVGAYCFAYYRRDGGSYRELRVDILPQC